MAKALTIQEPYASLFLLGLKHYETRSSRTHYRGEIYIHSGLKTWPYWYNNRDLTDIFDPKTVQFPSGMVIAKGILTDCVPTSVIGSQDEKKYGFYDGERYAWKIDGIQPVKPFLLKGKLGIFDFDDSEVVLL